MERMPIVIRHGGQWERVEYIGGDEVVVFIPIGQLCRATLMRQIIDQIDDNGGFDYLLFYTSKTNEGEGRKIKVALNDDDDLDRLLLEQKSYPIVYVIGKYKKSTTCTQERTGAAFYGSQRSTILSEVDPANTRAQIDSDNNNETSSEEDEAAASDDDEKEKRRKEILESVITEVTAWIRQSGQFDSIIERRNFSSKHQTVGEACDEFDESTCELRNWEIPILDFDSALPLGWVEPPVTKIGEFLKGSTFRSKDDLSIAVGLYHMENNLEYGADRSSKTRLYFVCKHDDNGCPFKLCAVQKAGIWRVIKCIWSHTCPMDLNRTALRQVPAKVVGKYFARKLVGEGVVLKPKEMITEMQRLFGIVIDYTFALRSRNLAIEMTYGAFEESYQMLPSYLHLLRMSNPGTLYDLETGPDGEFRHMFLALGQCVHAFERHLRPVVVVDGTHLKGRNKGILFIAVTKYGNEGIFPLAIGIGPIENDESWTYFFHRLRQCIGQPDDMLIVSDQHKSIKNAVENVYPNVSHVLCFYHMQKNLAHYGQHVAAIFKSAAYAYRSEEFHKNFTALQVLKLIAHRHLCDIGEQRWARSKCPVRRSSFMTSNAVEALNSRLLWARRLSICSLLECYRSIVEKWFDERHASAIARSHELTEKTALKLQVAVETGRHLVVRGMTTHMFIVDQEKKSYVVDLHNLTCDCKEFELDGIPCRHACAAIRRVGLKVTDFVAKYFHQSSLMGTYLPHIGPVPHLTYWDVPHSISAYIIRPPNIKRQSGRPKMSRTRSAVETSSSTRRQVCSRCKARGHNKRACTTQLALGGVDLNVPLNEQEDNQPSVRRRRQKKKCSICRSQDHTKNACPMRED